MPWWCRTITKNPELRIWRLMIDPSLPRISITELRRHFSRIIGDVESGQTVVITRRGREVAVLIPAGHYTHFG